MIARLRTALVAVLLAGLAGCAPAPPRSALLIVVDTLRADHLGLYGYPRATSPELDALAETAAVYDNAFATSPWTLPSFGSLFTGRLPAEHHAGWRAASEEGSGRSFLPMRTGLPTLAEALSAADRDTAAVMNNAFLHSDFGVARGFDTYDHVGGNRRRIRRADEVVDRALDWLNEDGRGDFLLVVHFFDPHLNYDAPESFRGRFTTKQIGDAERHRLMDLRRLRRQVRQKEPVDWRFLIGAYDEEIAFVDQEIGRLFRGLEQSGRLADTLIVLTADHGEEFGEHGGFEHGHSVYNELVRVPFLIWGPGVEPGRRTEPVSLIDVLPTVLEALELSPLDGLPGRSLVASLAGQTRRSGSPRTLIAERTLYGMDRESAITWPYKVIRAQRGGVQLFNLEDDPKESQNISRLRREIATELVQRLDAYRLKAELQGQDEAVEPDEETLENLRALGYIQ